MVRFRFFGFGFFSIELFDSHAQFDQFDCSILLVFLELGNSRYENWCLICKGLIFGNIEVQECVEVSILLSDQLCFYAIL